MIHLLRRSAPIATAASGGGATVALRTLAAAILSFSSAGAVPVARASASATSRFGAAPRRDLHFSAGPVGFRASDAAQAAPAVEEFYDDAPAAAGGLDIAGLGIAQDIVDKLARKNITQLFPIQKAVLEPAMQGRDMIGRAKTGTGKTLAFGIPILDKIIQFQTKHGRGKNPLALVLAPTRELTKQVEKELQESASVDTLCVYGGSPIQQQMRALDYGVDVVVGTPGRVIDLLNRGALVLADVQFLVLDEADEMLNVGFAVAVENILEKLPLQRQSLMFSATMPPSIRSLTRKYLKDPVIIDLVGENDQKLAEGITLYSIASERYSKPSILATLIKEHAKDGKCIIFTERKRDADQLSYSLGRSLNCQALHGDISQVQRERTLSSFREGGFNVLVATDVAARGLDVPNVDLVVHFEVPNNSETFVHRSGRTGRAGKKGRVILIYSQDQSRIVKGIELDTGCKFTELPKITVEGGESMMGGMGGYGGYGGQGPRGGSGGYGGYNNRSYGGGGGGGYSSSSSGRYGGSGNGRYGGSGYGGSGFGSTGGSFGGSGSGSTGGSFGGSGFGRSGGFSNSGQGSSGGFPASTGSFGSFGNSGGSSGRFPASTGNYGPVSNSGGSSGSFPTSTGNYGSLSNSGGSSGSFPTSTGNYGSLSNSGGSSGSFPASTSNYGSFSNSGGSPGSFPASTNSGGSSGSFPASTGNYGTFGNSGGRSNKSSDPQTNRYGGFGQESSDSKW